MWLLWVCCGVEQKVSGVTVQVVGVRARSRGRVSLRSNNPFDMPHIECK